MKYFILLAAGLILTTSCNNGEKLANTNLSRERDSIMRLADERENSVNEFIVSFNEIERNLDSVAAKQRIINANAQKGRDSKLDQKERINSQIAAINKLMEENIQKISELKKKLSKASRKNGRLEETIITLNNQLAQKNDELCALNDRLSEMDIKVAQLNSTIDTLNGKNLAQAETINNNVTAMHTAYYVIGKTKDLQEAKLIDRKGGLLGIGRTPQLSENFDSEKFTRIDYSQTPSIPVNSDGVKIITTHPSDSYSLEHDEKDKDVVKNIVITNPDKFWSASKYLVVVKR